MGFWDLKIVRLLDYGYLRVLNYKNLELWDIGALGSWDCDHGMIMV